jgi:hypothetical protein
MTNPIGKKQESEYISQESEDINQENDNIEETEIYYDGIIWVKYTIDYSNYKESAKNECTVIFPLDSNKWIWNYKMLGENKIIIVDGEEYKILGFSWQCYDGIMKNGSSIVIKKIS